MNRGRSQRTFIGAATAGTFLATAGVAGAWAVTSGQKAITNTQLTAVYVARFLLNTNMTGSSATGEARFTIQGDSLSITVKARGLPKDIEHWQHFHGFTDGRQAACPSGTADVNHDGIIDVVETG